MVFFTVHTRLSPTAFASTYVSCCANTTWTWDFVGSVLAVCHIPLILPSRWLWLNIQYGRKGSCSWLFGWFWLPANVKGPWPDGSLHLIARRTRATHFNIAVDIEMLLSQCILHWSVLHRKIFVSQLVRHDVALGTRHTCLLIGV